MTWGETSNTTRYEIMGEMSGTLYSGTARHLYRVKPNGTYYYKVRACNSNACSAFSAKKGITVTIIPSKAFPPIASSMYQPVNTNVSISWPAVANAISYKLYEDGTVIYSGSGRAISKRHNSYGRRIYTVAACSSAGCSAQSNAYPIYYYTAPGGVNNLAVSNSTAWVGDSVNVSWNAAGGSVPGTKYQIAVNGAVKASTKALSQRLVLTKTGNNQIRVNACNPNNTGCGSSRYVNVNVSLKVTVNKFAWFPSTLKVGESTAFHWDIANVETCFATTRGPGAPLERSPTGKTDNYTYTEPGVHTTKWYCKDSQGNRFPEDATKYLEAVRTVKVGGLQPVLGSTSGGVNILTWIEDNRASYYQVIITDENGVQRVVKVYGTSYSVAGLALG
ncbi:hypothetical protein, partial [Shewanella sairae]|uniref:hypothetical protein n=1 Tax=Shewanella sairae TaxID=190310 RepID=UPI001C7F9AAE